MRTPLVLSLTVVGAALSAIACGNGGSSSGAGGHGGAGSPAASSGSSMANSSSGSNSSTSGSNAGSSSSGMGGGAPAGDSVVQRNNHASRDGLFIQPTLTKAAAANMHLDATFNASIQGHVYASPLYVENGPGGKGVLFVETENNGVYAVAEADGAAVWNKTLGTAAGATGAGCGNIAPIGITGTPYIDLASRTMYLDAAIGNANTIQKHEIHALSIDDGSEKAGFPVDTSTVKSNNLTFNPVVQGERGSVIMVNGTVYVPYGGHYGDCGPYHGWVIGVPVNNPAAAKGWATPAQGGGMWAPGGLSSDGTNVFVTTGNTFGANTWQGGEAIIRLQAGPVFSNQPTDYFVPSDWKNLDNGDIDIGGSGPLLIDVPGATPSALAVALGKNGVAYLIDRNNLGGVGKGNGTTGEGVASAKVASGQIINAAASYQTAKGVYVVFHIRGGGSGVGCPGGQSGDLVSLLIGAASPPTITVAWCAKNQGNGSPIVTTTDGKAEAVVWTVGAEGSMALHGFDGDTGAVIFGGGAAADKIPKNVRRFTSPIAVKGRIFTVSDDGLYAFKSQ